MRRLLVHTLLAVICLAGIVHAQCAKDHRSGKSAGILVTDFTITGTQTIGASELARIAAELTGECFNDDSDEMQERVKAAFQDRGYMTAEVKSFRIKPADPLGVPKPVTIEAEVTEGPLSRLGEITFLENHAFSSEELRQQFPLKKGDVFERGKVANGLESLRDLYGSHGYLDMLCILDDRGSPSMATVLKIKMVEGPQYHMGKLEVLAEKDLADRLRLEWKLAEGAVYDAHYTSKYIQANRSLLPDGFSRENVTVAQDCPQTLVQVRLEIDPNAAKPKMKNIPCESSEEKKKQ